jgi:cation transport regulator ChaC
VTAAGEHIFGYGSLACPENLGRFLRRHGIPRVEARYARLKGFRRAWNVAHDNMVERPGCRIYVDPVSGARHRGAVTFLNVYRALGHAVNGVVFEVPAAALAPFDRRERDYARLDVTDEVEVEGGLAGRVWVYSADVTGLGAHSVASAAGTAVVPAGYVGEIEAAFAARGEAAYREFLQSTDWPNLPLRDLVGRDLP